jgi:hypothetical protein
MHGARWWLITLWVFCISCGSPEPPPTPSPSPDPIPEPLSPTTTARIPAPAARPAAPPALASHETNWPGIVAELTEFRRKGNTLTAQLRLRNLRPQQSPTVQFTFEDVYITDEPGAKKYSVLEDERGSWIASTNGSNLWRESFAPGQSFTIWMKFPAPPRDVRTLTLQFPNTTPFEDVRIEDR